jgi:hypothetical protein
MKRLVGRLVVVVLALAALVVPALLRLRGRAALLKELAAAED